MTASEPQAKASLAWAAGVVLLVTTPYLLGLALSVLAQPDAPHYWNLVTPTLVIGAVAVLGWGGWRSQRAALVLAPPGARPLGAVGRVCLAVGAALVASGSAALTLQLLVPLYNVVARLDHRLFAAASSLSTRLTYATLLGYGIGGVGLALGWRWAKLETAPEDGAEATVKDRSWLRPWAVLGMIWAGPSWASLLAQGLTELRRPEAAVGLIGFTALLALSVWGLAKLPKAPPPPAAEPSSGGAKFFALLLCLVGGAAVLLGTAISAVLLVSDLLGTGHAHASGLGYLAMGFVGAPCLILGFSVCRIGWRQVTS